MEELALFVLPRTQDLDDDDDSDSGSESDYVSNALSTGQQHSATDARKDYALDDNISMISSRDGDDSFFGGHWALEPTYSSSQVPASTDNDAVLVSPTLRQAKAELTLTDEGYELSLSPRLPESSRNFPSEISPTVESDYAAMVIPNVGAWSPNDSRHHGNAVSERQFVGYGEVDPEKHTKRIDRAEGKYRGKAMSDSWHGACFACRKAKRQCKGEEVCKRCRSLRLACVRTCDSCWATKKRCDEKAPCKNCQRLGIDCHRPPVPTIISEDSRADDLPPLPTPLQLGHTKSTAPVNNHTT